jgi:hypothetical protein
MLVRDPRIEAALDRAWDTATLSPPFEISQDKWILFSDLHRGGRDGADDFLPAERALNTALDHYYTAGHSLLLLGDIEELWEEHPERVVSLYRDSLEREARFFRAGRYTRLWGNHDDDWQSRQTAHKYLAPVFGGDPEIASALRVPVLDHGKPIGEFFLTHGHQGTGDSDRFAGISRFIVRHVWRPVQRLIGYSFNTPSTDFSLREHHDQTMYAWAAQRDNLVLIVGHTHRPVFKSLKHAAQLKREIEALEAQLKEAGDHSETLKQINELRIKLEQVISQDGGPDTAGVDTDMTQPCYFNTGCCCYPDGDITGIELAAGEIRLVRWGSATGKPMKTLARASLRGIFAELRAG